MSLVISYVAILALVVMRDDYNGELNARYHSDGSEFLSGTIVPVKNYSKIYIDIDGKVYEANIKDTKTSYLLGYIDKKVATSEKRILTAIKQAKIEILTEMALQR